jgi:uncharacterized zinc-type alcohol dehydrogenase-like protein
MGVKFGHALGAHVTMITTSPEKGEDARRLGADQVLISRDTEAMAAAAGKFDFILNTIPVAHDLQPYVQLLGFQGAMVLVGAIEPLPSVHGWLLVQNDRSIGGSLIGGIAATQEMLDFCAEKQILADCEVIRIQDINDAYERMLRSDVKYRFVIDMASLSEDRARA